MSARASDAVSNLFMALILNDGMQPDVRLVLMPVTRGKSVAAAIQAATLAAGDCGLVNASSKAAGPCQALAMKPGLS
jgi:hypothetical protein